MPAAVTRHWQPCLSKHSSSRLQSEPGRREGRDGKKGAVTLGWVIFDVHVKALTRGMWPACTLEASSQAAALGTGSNAVPESAAHLLTLCTCLVPHKDAPCRPSSTPPSLCRNDFSQ